MRVSKQKLFTGLTISLIILCTLSVGELALWIFYPQPCLYPRFEFSESYGFVTPAATSIVNMCPGRWRFIYTTNEYGCRGKAIPVSDSYDKDNIIILGDSFSFGLGVNDGEEYAALLSDHLKERYNVINLGCGGWGLTQEIRRYYDFGVLYKPKIAVLQFTGNDPDDNLLTKVTTLENGKFVFHENAREKHWFKKYLAHSIVQRSQIYNLIRNALAMYLDRRELESQTKHREKDNEDKRSPSVQEQFYGDLLEAFANDLARQGIVVMMISVNGQLEGWPYINAVVDSLSKTGKLKYYDVAPWFHGLDPSEYSSPEGHHWGALAHKIVADSLAAIIKSRYN